MASPHHRLPRLLLLASGLSLTQSQRQQQQQLQLCDNPLSLDCVVSAPKLLNCSSQPGACTFAFNSLTVNASVAVACETLRECELDITLSAFASIGWGAALVATTVSIVAGGDISIAEGGAVSADGLGLSLGPGSPGLPENGASNGGSGGILPCSLTAGAACCDGFSAFVADAAGVGSFSNPPSFWDSYALGSGSGADPAAGRGGGRIRLVAGGSITVDGSVSANGAASLPGSEFGSGAGGSVTLVSAQLTGAGLIQANGGPASISLNQTGGGGGRVNVNVSISDFDLSYLQAEGGTLEPGLASPGRGCYSGSAGTVYLVQPPPAGSPDGTPWYTQLQIANGGNEDILAVTPLYIPYFSTALNASSGEQVCAYPNPDYCAAVDALSITDGANVATDFLNLRTYFEVLGAGVEGGQGAAPPKLGRSSSSSRARGAVGIRAAGYGAWSRRDASGLAPRRTAAAAAADARPWGASQIDAVGLSITSQGGIMPLESVLIHAIVPLSRRRGRTSSAAAAAAATADGVRRTSRRGRRTAPAQQQQPRSASHPSSPGLAELSAQRRRAQSSPSREELLMLRRREGGKKVGEEGQRIPPRPPLAPNVTIQCSAVIIKDGYVDTGTTALLMDVTWVEIRGLTVITFTGVFSIRARDTIFIDGELGPPVTGPRDQLPVDDTSEPELALRAVNGVTLDRSSSVHAALLHVYSDSDVQILGLVRNRLSNAAMSDLCTQPPPAARATCSDVVWDPAQPMPPLNNYSLVLLAGLTGGNLVVDNLGKIFGNVLLLCGQNVSLQSLVSVDMGGCPGGTGWGPGLPGPVAGGGAGHASNGGPSVGGNDAGEAYGGGIAPVQMGSGGGSRVSSLGGSGGGYLQVAAGAIVLETTADVTADGEWPSGNAGGGSGGTVVLSAFSVSGQGIISASGGNGDTGGGGASGGSVRFLLPRQLLGGGGAAPLPLPFALAGAAAPPPEGMNDGFYGVVLVNGGEGDSGGGEGGNGTIASPNCPPGLGGVPRCSPCGAGLWRNGSIASPFCSLCTNKPSRGFYSDPQATSPDCDYLCPAGTLYPSCNTVVEEIVNAFGSPARMGLTIATFLVALLVILTGLYYKRAAENAAFNRMYDEGSGISALSSTDQARLGGGGLHTSSGALGLGAPSGGSGSGGGALWRSIFREKSSALWPTWGAGAAGEDEELDGWGGGHAGRGAKAGGTSSTALLFSREGRRSGAAHGAVSGDAGAAASSSHFISYGATAPLAAGDLKLGPSSSSSPSTPALPSSGAPSSSGALSGMGAVIALLRPPAAGRASSAPSSRAAIEFLVAQACLHEDDLPRLALRIYLGGTNSFGSPWTLPAAVPAAARRLVRASHYPGMVAEVSHALRWQTWGWERLCYGLLGLLAAPAASDFLKWRRRLRVGKLLQLLLARENSHYWLRDAVAVALQDNLRVGISADFTLAYVDILRGLDPAGGGAGGKRGHHHRTGGSEPSSFAVPRPLPSPPSYGNSKRGNALPSGPLPLSLRLPLALLMCGDGSYEFPLHLDPNDALVRAVPSVPGLSGFIDRDWIEFVAEFNLRARCLTSGAEIQTSGPVLSFLRAVSANANLLGGLRVELVRFWPTVRSSVEESDAGAVGDLGGRGGRTKREASATNLRVHRRRRARSGRPASGGGPFPQQQLQRGQTELGGSSAGVPLPPAAGQEGTPAPRRSLGDPLSSDGRGREPPGSGAGSPGGMLSLRSSTPGAPSGAGSNSAAYRPPARSAIALAAVGQSPSSPVPLGASTPGLLLPVPAARTGVKAHGGSGASSGSSSSSSSGSDSDSPPSSAEGGPSDGAGSRRSKLSSRGSSRRTQQQQRGDRRLSPPTSVGEGAAAAAALSHLSPAAAAAAPSPGSLVAPRPAGPDAGFSGAAPSNNLSQGPGREHSIVLRRAATLDGFRRGSGSENDEEEEGEGEGAEQEGEEEAEEDALGADDEELDLGGRGKFSERASSPTAAAEKVGDTGSLLLTKRVSSRFSLLSGILGGGASSSTRTARSSLQRGESPGGGGAAHSAAAALPSNPTAAAVVVGELERRASGTGRRHPTTGGQRSGSVRERGGGRASDSWWGSFSRLSDDVCDTRDLRLGLLLSVPGAGGAVSQGTWGAGTGVRRDPSSHSRQGSRVGLLQQQQPHGGTRGSRGTAVASIPEGAGRHGYYGGGPEDDDGIELSSLRPPVPEHPSRHQLSYQQQQQHSEPTGVPEYGGGYVLDPEGEEQAFQFGVSDRGVAGLSGTSPRNPYAPTHQTPTRRSGRPGPTGSAAARNATPSAAAPQWPTLSAAAASSSYRSILASGSSASAYLQAGGADPRYQGGGDREQGLARGAGQGASHSSPHAAAAAATGTPGRHHPHPQSQSSISSAALGPGGNSGAQLEALGPVIVRRSHRSGGCVSATLEYLASSYVELGGHDDALGLRVDMRMPYPGIRVPLSRAPVTALPDSPFFSWPVVTALLVWLRGAGRDDEVGAWLDTTGGDLADGALLPSSLNDAVRTALGFTDSDWMRRVILSDLVISAQRLSAARAERLSSHQISALLAAREAMALSSPSFLQRGGAQRLLQYQAQPARLLAPAVHRGGGGSGAGEGDSSSSSDGSGGGAPAADRQRSAQMQRLAGQRGPQEFDAAAVLAGHSTSGGAPHPVFPGHHHSRGSPSSSHAKDPSGTAGGGELQGEEWAAVASEKVGTGPSGAYDPRRRNVLRYATPAPPSALWLAGVSCTTLCITRWGGCSVSRACRRVVFVGGRVLRRPTLPLPQQSRGLLYALTVAHLFMMIVDLLCTFLMVSELFCVEPLDDSGEATAPLRRLLVRAGGIDDALAANDCNYVPLSIYVSLPPAAFLVVPLLGLAAVSLQSARALRLYAVWNGGSLWSAVMAIALVLYNVPVLGTDLLILPAVMVGLKLLCAQAVPYELAAIEAHRPAGVRGWRGLYEVRNGPAQQRLRGAETDWRTGGR